MKNKYGAKKCQLPHVPGIWFDSQLERALYLILEQEQLAGLIKELKHHPGTVFLCECRTQFRPDFVYIDAKTGERVWAESKGFPTAKWPLVKKHWKLCGPGKLHIYMGSHKYLKLVETIDPKEKNASRRKSNLSTRGP